MMKFFGQRKWKTFLVALIAALLCCSTPIFAAGSSKNKSEQQSSEKKSKSTKASTKKQAPKSQSKKTSTKKDLKKNKSASKATNQKSSKKVDKNKTAQKSKDDSQIEDAPADTVTKKVVIQSNDPKAFTKAILYEKEGVEVDFVDIRTLKKEVPKINFNKGDFFDFSSMLIPVTHEARLGSPYGIRDHRLHRGVDVQVIKEEPVVAAFPGTVVVSKYNKGGYGHYVMIEHEDGLQTLYGHLAERAVRVGDIVFPGDIVGLAGNSGKSSGAHLHFEIRYKDINIDPKTVVNFPKWELQPEAGHLSKKKLISAHYNIQKKLKKENVYIVKKGDTIKDVAAWFYISEDAVCRINGLKKDQPLKVGQRLKGSK